MIKIQDVTFRYPKSDKEVLSRLNLEIADGEFLCIIGHSGCGKSTLLKLIRRRRRIASCPRQPVFLTAWYSSFNPARICSRACSGRIPRSPGLQFHVYHLFLDCGFIIPHDKALFCDEVTLIKKKIGAEKAPVLNRSIHFRRWSPSVSRSVIAPRFSSTRPSSEKLLSIRATASRAELMC